MRRTGEGERDESPSERADRNFSEALQEVRVVQVGVQVLFGFLLSLAFMSRFPDDRRDLSVVLTVALLASAASALSFIAPVWIHRVHFREGRKEAVLWVAQRCDILGLVLLMVAMLASIWLVVAFLWSTAAAWAIAASVLLMVVLLLLAGEVVVRRR